MRRRKDIINSSRRSISQPPFEGADDKRQHTMDDNAGVYSILSDKWRIEPMLFG